MVSDSVCNLMMELITLGFVVPVVFIAVWKMRTRESLLPVLAGAGGYLVFAELLQSVPDTLVLGLEHPLANCINHNVWLLMLYTAITVSVLHGLGRYLAFRYFWLENDSPALAVSFGLGFGGLGCMMELGVTNISNYSLALMINQKQTDTLLQSMDAAAAKSYQSLITELTELSRMDLLLTAVQQFTFLFLQVALTVLVFYAVHKTGQMRFLGISMVLHAIILFLDVFAKAEIVPRFVVVLCMIILTVGIVQMAYRQYQSFVPQVKSDEKQQDGWNYAKKRYIAKEEPEQKDTDL